MKIKALLGGLAGFVVLTVVVGCGNAATSGTALKNTTANSPTNAVTNTIPAVGTKTSGNQTSANKTVPTSSSSTSYTDAQLATMTLAQLASYSQKHGEPLWFASNNVFRSSPKTPVLVSNPKSNSMFGSNFVQAGGGKYPSSEFYVVDSWSGSIQGHSFELEVDKKKDGNKYIVGVMYGKMSRAIALNKQPWIINFTGSYVVFASPNPAQGNPMYAINLMNGNVVPSNSQNSEYVRLMSGVGMGGYRSGISGLSKSYDNFPNGKQSY